MFLRFYLGENAMDFSRRLLDSDPLEGDTYGPPEIRQLTSDSFMDTLLVLCAIYEFYLWSPENQKFISDRVSMILSEATCDLDIRWKDGFFYRSGAEELDKSLIEEPLIWLKDYPNEKKDYLRALEIYSSGKNLGDVIKNCYSALEGVVRSILGNSKTIDNNKEALLQKIELPSDWKAILANYITYAHNFRHASKERHVASLREVEAFLYMTGLLIRLIIESK